MYSDYKTPYKCFSLKTGKYVCNKFGLAEFFARHYCEFEKNSKLRILDVGCGVMPIGIFLADLFQCDVTGIDLNPEACRCAESNANNIGIKARVKIINTDFAKFARINEREKYDIIVANPPVDDDVSSEEIARYAGMSYENPDDSSYSFLTNSWHSSEGKDLADYIFEFRDNILKPDGRIILVFCTVDCDSPEYIYKKARLNGCNIIKVVDENISAESIGVESLGLKETHAFMAEFGRRL